MHGKIKKYISLMSGWSDRFAGHGIGSGLGGLLATFGEWV
jgi:hypothetical protein